MSSPKRKPPQRTYSSGTADDLVSVTVKKTDPNQKAGIKLVQKEGGVFVSAVVEGGLFDGSEIGVNDRVLSINGHRLQAGQSFEVFMYVIAEAKEKVTIVVKRANLKARRGVRSSKSQSSMTRKKLVHKDGIRNLDGSLNLDINPGVSKFVAAIDDKDDKPQFRIRAQKLFQKQGPGVTFKKIGEMLFVSGIAMDSIFRDTQLALGDRIVEVNDVNFMNYADGPYADILLTKSKEKVSMVLEKGWKTFNAETDTDSCHNKPSKDSSVGDNSEMKESKHKSSSKDSKKKLQRRHSSKSKKKTRRPSNRSTGTDNSSFDGDNKFEIQLSGDSGSSGDSDDQDSRYVVALFSPKESSTSNLRFLEHAGDYLCVTIKKKSEKHPGIKVQKVEGMFILKKVPSYEKRIPIGSEVLAINGSYFKSEGDAKGLIDGTPDRVVLIINFEQPVLQVCPCCGKWMTTNGEHFKE